MATAKASLQGLQSASRPLSDAELMQQYDEERRLDRAEADAQETQPGTSPAQRSYFDTFNRSREDAATGPAGYNRQWVPLLESLKGKRLLSAPGLPTETYADPTGTGTLTRQTTGGATPEGPFGPFGAGTGGNVPTAPGQQLASLSMRPKPPMPESHEAFMARLVKQYGAR